MITYSPGFKPVASKKQPVIRFEKSVPPILATLNVPGSEPSDKAHKSIISSSLHTSVAGSSRIGGQLQSSTVIVTSTDTLVHGSCASLVVKVKVNIDPIG